MNGIEEIIEHLQASKIASGEGLAALDQAKATLQVAYDKLQDAFNHVAVATGNGNSESLRVMLAVLDSAKADVTQTIFSMQRVPDLISMSQEKTDDYIGRLMG